ncbi:hypothetical protein SAMN02746041_00239 [Desulfacinum hydrothermale DSM 13146]|uniref:Uncharacterized protein n=1 Tax=Desulfacinum hydrothermale DSM 13146 TaxID=1121390 RepID=A0A1W1WZJ6_9BACT|nr:hypothetical protein [Desulfacinum hydrothermale]SMC17152.1 hypothetical protein SAMN02746041_00239 [Desulfacinum hydrothermale DSM 13146]
MKRSVTLFLTLLLVVSYLGLPGCGSGPDIVSEEKKPGQEYSAAEVREILIDHPFLLSGDYFRERRDLKPMVLGSVLSQAQEESTEELKAQLKEKEKRLARLEKAVFQGRRPALPAEALRIKVGFLVDPQKVPAHLADRLLAQADRLAVTYDVLFVHHRDLEQVLSGTDCLQKRDLACITRIAAIYPGTRFICLVESVSVPASLPGTASARFGLVDAGIGYRYPLVQMEMPVKSDADVATFLELMVRRSYEQALDKKSTMPWVTHVFSGQSGQWFVSAGNRSGLLVGDLLDVVSEGKLVKAPTGVPAAWIPGPPKGRLRVERLFGDDLAIATLVSGDPPQMSDYLIPVRAKP